MGNWGYNPTLGGGFKDFLFHPQLGKIPILTSNFQMGWNHQLAYLLGLFFGLVTRIDGLN